MQVAAAEGSPPRTADEIRASAYEILARLYDREVTPELVHELREVGFLAALADGCADFSLQDPLDCEELALEFSRLFVGPGPRTPPYGSVHRTDDERPGELWGSTTGEVKRFMAHYGLEPHTRGAIPDHIATLFEFMGRVIRTQLDTDPRGNGEAVGIAREIQRECFRRYLKPWVAVFCSRVRAAQPAPFYQALVVVTEAFFAEECTALSPDT